MKHLCLSLLGLGLWIGSASVLAGCATEQNDGLGGGGGSGTTTSVATTTSEATSTATASSTGSGLPCGQDCSTIDVPVCFEPSCNLTTHTCEIKPSADGAPCDDGLFCTDDDVCMDGACQGGPPHDCGDEGDECNGLACDEDEMDCVPHPKPNGTSCTSTTPCEDNAICQNGTCLGAPKDCSAVADDCNTAVCDPAQGGLCVTTPFNDGGGCSGGDQCFENKTCNAGACEGGTPIDCSGFAFGCFAAACDPVQGCISVPLASGDSCVPQGDECHAGTCDTFGDCVATATPGNDGVECFGGDICKENKTCLAGNCVGGTEMDCSFLDFGCEEGYCNPSFGFCDTKPIAVGGTCPEATDDCHVGICDAFGSCNPMPANDGASCDDGSTCTVNDTCSAGTCSGTSVGGGTIYWSEDFSDNSAGWTLGTEWQIGSATASDGTEEGGTFPDPDLDHTATADNGVAGVVIGGHPTKVNHGLYYLTSPVVDTSTIPGPLYVSFWRWLGSDYPPYMTDDIEVFDGTTWVTVWSNDTFDTTIADSAWNQQGYDIAAYKNPLFQVRFGFEIGDASGVYTVGSWNIDDVVLSSSPCN